MIRLLVEFATAAVISLGVIYFTAPAAFQRMIEEVFGG